MDDFIFGTQYLRGCSPEPTDWERDLNAIASHGFNTIRVWLVWGTLEVREGEIDTSGIEKILSIAERKNLRGIFLFHLHGAPEWLIRKYPQYRYVDRTGHAFEPSARSNTPSGGWPGLCPDHPEVQKFEERFIREIVTRIGSRAYAYEPINEPHMWIDATGSQVVDYCYCDATRDAFRQWLRQKYGSLEALSRAWGKCFDCWESVRPATWTFGYGDQVDFHEFTMENVARLMRRRVEVIRKYTDRPVIAHAWGGGSSCCPQLGAMAFDDWRNAAEVDSWGCSGFPDRVEASARLAQSMDATRSAAAGRIFWQSELGAGSLGGGMGFYQTAAPELLALWCWASIFHGAKGLLFWQYRVEIFGNESGFFGLTDRAGNPTDRLWAAEKFGKSVSGHAHEFMTAKVPDAEVALLFSPRAFLLDWTIHRNNQYSCNATAGYYDAFYHANIPIDFLHTHQLNPEKLRAYKLVIVPAALTLSRSEADLLTAYVAGGGAVLADSFTASWDESMKLSSVMPGAGLNRLFGVREKGYHSGNGNATLRGRKQSYSLSLALPHETWLQESENAVPFAETENGEWIVSEHRHGDGRAFLSGLPQGNLNARGDLIGDDLRAERRDKQNGDATKMILDIAALCGVTPSIRTAFPLHARQLILPGGGEILLFSNHSATPFSGEIVSDSRSNVSYTGIYGADNLNWVFSRDGRADIALPPYGNAVFLK